MTNTAADMAALLAASQDAHATYAAGQADPLTTGSVGGSRASLGSGGFIDTTQVALGPEPPPPPRGGEQLPPGVPTFSEDPPETTPVPVVAASIGSGSLTVGEADLDVIGSTPGGNGETSTSTGLSFVSGDKAISLSFAANQNPTVSGLDEGSAISWTLDPADPTGRTLLGTIGGVPVIVLTLTGDLTAAAGGDVATPTITAVLTGFVPHQDAPDADSLTITGIVVNATDADGQIISGTIEFTVADDAPLAVDDTAQVVAEDAAGTIGGNVLSNDSEGADGATLTHVQLPGGGFVAITTGAPVQGQPGAFSFTVGTGTYTFQADGTWTFDPALNENPNDVNASFNYRLTDGDGDSDDAVQPVTVTDGGNPTGGGSLKLDLEESDLDTTSLPDGSDLAVGTATGSTSGGAAETGSGSLSFSAGSDALTTFVFDNTAGISVSGLSGTQLTWTGQGTGTLIGQINGVDAIRLQLSGGPIAAGGSGNITVTATLIDNVAHSDSTVSIGNVTVKASQADGDSATGQVSLSVLDDRPDAVNDTGREVAEDAAGTISGNVLTNDTPGADGATLTHVQLPGGGFVAIGTGIPVQGQPGVFSFTVGAGTYTFKADGSWTFDPSNNLASPTSATFNYRITDGDNDTDEATQPINVIDGNNPAGGGQLALDLQESDLDTASTGDDDSGDLAPATTTGSTPSGPDETDSGTLSFTAGSDALTTFVFDNTAVISVSGLSGAQIAWAGEGTGTLIGRINGVDAIRLQLSGGPIAAGGSGNITVTATLIDNVTHIDTTVSIGNVTVKASQADGDSATGQVSLSVLDDRPDAVDETVQTTAEDAAVPINGNVLTNDTSSADGTTLTHVQLPGGSFVAINTGVPVEGQPGAFSFTVGVGTYTFKADGTWTFDPAPNNSPNDVTASFKYRIADGDNDTDEATQPINVIDGNNPTGGGQLALELEESDLDTASTGGDLAPATTTGSTPSGPDETDSGTLSFTAGSDALTTFVFDNTAGISVSGLSGTPITWIGQGTGTLTGQINGVDAIRLQLSGGPVTAGGSGNITVTATLIDNVAHSNSTVSIGNVTVKASQADGDSATGQVNLTVKDDVPVARGDTASTIEGENLNAVFILDFSGSIDNTELNTMLNAVKTAGQTLFNGTSGDVKLQIVAFSSTAISYGPFTSYASFASQIDAINGGNRPLNGGTDFTAAIQTTMSNWAPISGWSNQAFFISDGNPTEQTGSNGNSLSNTVAAQWNTFVDSNGIDVTAIGIGDGINNARLQDVDLDGLGTPIAVANFSGLITTLLAEISGNQVSGNVLTGSVGDGDISGADGPGRIVSIQIGGITYTWNGTAGADAIDPGTPNNAIDDIDGTTLTAIPTPNGGELTFNFATGAWSYTAPTSISGDVTETFQYSITDTDGDVSSAPLTIHVEDRAGQLDGVLKTNPSAQNQFLTLSFFELAAAEFRDSLHATAKIYDPFQHAPQGSIIQDAGFDISGTADYGVVLEASTTSATSIQVSEFAIENVTIEPTANPTAALQKDNTSGTGTDSTAIVAVIDPGSSISAVLEQSKTVSTDGSAHPGNRRHHSHRYSGQHAQLLLRRRRSGHAHRQHRQGRAQRRRRRGHAQWLAAATIC